MGNTNVCCPIPWDSHGDDIPMDKPAVIVANHGRPQKFFQGMGQSQNFAIIFKLLTINVNGRSQNALPFFYITKIMHHVTVTITKNAFRWQQLPGILRSFTQ